MAWTVRQYLDKVPVAVGKQKDTEKMVEAIQRKLELESTAEHLVEQRVFLEVIQKKLVVFVLGMVGPCLESFKECMSAKKKKFNASLNTMYFSFQMSLKVY